MASTWWICITRVRWCGSMQSTNSKGPPSRSAGSVGMRTSLATTASPPNFARSARVNSEPICPTAPVTRIFFIALFSLSRSGALLAGSPERVSLFHRAATGESCVECQVVKGLQRARTDQRPTEQAFLQEGSGEQRAERGGEAARHVGHAGGRHPLFPRHHGHHVGLAGGDVHLREHRPQEEEERRERQRRHQAREQEEEVG